MSPASASPLWADNLDDLVPPGIAVALAAPLPSPAWWGFADPGAGHVASGPEEPNIAKLVVRQG